MRNKPIVVLIAVLLSSISLPITLTGASVALPDIAEALDADLAPVQWVVTGYNATFASFMLAAGSLADLIGRRRVFTGGVAVFAVTGLLSIVTTNILVLDVVRAVAGAGAAAAAASGAALLAANFEGPARTRAFGVFGTTLGVGLAFGPTIGGFVVSAFGWRGVFGVPAAAALIVLLMTPLLPESRESGGRRLDTGGAVTFTAFLLLLITGFVEGPARGWLSPVVLGAFVGSAVLLAAFVVIERRRPDPMLDLGLLASPRFMAFSVTAAVILCVLIPLVVYLPSYFTEVLGMSSERAGTVLIALTAPSLVLPSLAGVIAKWVPPSAIVMVAVVLVGAGAAWMALAGPKTGTGQLLGPLLTIGFGFGISMGLIDGVAISSVAVDRAGTAAGMLNTARLASETVAIAVVGAVLAATTDGRLADPGFSGGLRTVLWAMAGLAVVTLLVCGALLRRGGRVSATTAPTAESVPA
ncbi:MFS transporter [Thermomonospora umbrina]|uniref:MFS transporter n=1 Tax=Thermomonospora umbrina TaxID=111806 RepID=A0A3D9SSU0_9ACTN|nr:MFS transporter [Thermomonospora umbrina]REE99046.1 MFS transporter [Thermomonospora umbrina]